MQPVRVLMYSGTLDEFMEFVTDYLKHHPDQVSAFQVIELDVEGEEGRGHMIQLVGTEYCYEFKNKKELEHFEKIMESQGGSTGQMH